MTETASASGRTAPLTPDICVIGGGAAGLAVATTAAMFGVSVVLVERDRPGGHPSHDGALGRALQAAAGRARTVAEAPLFGVTTGEVQVDHARLRDHLGHVTGLLAPNETAERLAALGIVLLRGEARFRNRQTAAVGETEIRARRFVVATGSRPAMPEIPGLAALSRLSEETIFELPKRPDRLLVLGGGAAAVSLAQAMRRLGSEVALAAPDGLLPEEDPEAAGLVRRSLLRDDIALHEGVAVLRAESHRHHPRLVLAGGSVLQGTHLLVASGRVPDIGSLELDLAGIRGDAGGIAVDRGLRTSNRRVYAIGACAGGAAAGLDSVHAARHQAALVVRNALFRLPAKLDRHAIPRVIQSDPPVASVGQSEREARERGAVQVLRWPYAEAELTSAERGGEGLIKLVADRKGRVLGVTIAGAQAAELIAPWCLAVQQRLGLTEMAGLALPSLSYSEISQRVALSSYAPLAVKPGIRRLIGFLRRFG